MLKGQDIVILTHWGRDKMTAIFLTTFWNAFSWMKICELCLRFHWNVFGRFELTIFHHWFRQLLGADQATSHYLRQWWLAYWRIYASLGLNELRRLPHVWLPYFCLQCACSLHYISPKIGIYLAYRRTDYVYGIKYWGLSILYIYHIYILREHF